MKIFGLGMITLIFSNEEKDDIMGIMKPFEESSLWIKVVNETIQNEAEEQKGGFLGMLLHTLGASLLGILLTGKGMKAKITGRGVIRAGEGTIRAGESTIKTGQNF